MEFDLPNGDTVQQKAEDATEKTRDDKQYLVFTCEVSAKEMTEDIVSRYIKADGTRGERTAYKRSSRKL